MTPNHALQRTTPGVTPYAPTASNRPATDPLTTPTILQPTPNRLRPHRLLRIDERRRAHLSGCLRQSVCLRPARRLGSLRSNLQSLSLGPLGAHQMTTQLIAVIILALMSVANADPIPVTYTRIHRNAEYSGVFQGHANDKPTPGIAAPFYGKVLAAAAPVQQITVWHNYAEQVSEELVRQKLPYSDFLWILEHCSMRAAREQDHINIPAGTMVDVHYKNGFILRINTSEKTAYGGTLISPTGEYESVGFWYHSAK
jgi:hypothetical protein